MTDAADARRGPVCRNRRRLRRRRFGAFAVALVSLIVTGAAQAAALALVLAVDVSESVSSERYLLQHEGIARAFETPLLVDAIAAVPGGIEALVLEWSDPDKIDVNVRCLDNIDLAAIKAVPFDGRHWEEAYAAKQHLP